MPTNRGLIYFSLILSTGLIVVALIVGATLHSIKVSDSTVSVTGSAQKIITSDTAKWYGSFSRTVGVDGLKDGYAQMKKDLEVTMAYLKECKLSGEMITVNPITVSPMYEGVAYGGQGKLTGYVLTQQIIVEKNNVDDVRLAAQNSGNLLNQNVIFTSSQVEYYYSKLDDLKLDLLADATSNAKERAERIAKSSGAAVGQLRSAGMGVFQITAINSTDVSDYGSYDTSAIQKKVTAVARTSFSLR